MLAVLFLVSAWWLGLWLDDRLRLSRGDGLVRLSAGFVLGAFCATWLVYLLSLWLGFSRTTLALGTAVLAAANVLACRQPERNRAWLASLRVLDRPFWQAAALPTLFLTLIFSDCIGFNAGGDILFRGNSRDFAYHLGTISSFIEQSGFPPENPQAAGHKLSYHFMADFFSAILLRGGFSPFYCLKLPMVLLAFSLGTLGCHFFHVLLRSRVGTFSAGCLFFLGHVGLVNCVFGLAGFPSGNTPFSPGSWDSVVDHVTYPYYNFLNVVIDYFQPQFPFLFSFPLVALLLPVFTRTLAGEDSGRAPVLFAVAMTGLLPLFHMHSFLVLGPVAALAALRPLVLPGLTADGAPPPAGWIRTLGIGLLAATAAGLQVAFILSQPKVPGFSGFDVAARLGDLPEIPALLGFKRPLFWLRAAGATLVPGLIGLGIGLAGLRRRPAPERLREYALLPLFLVGTGYFMLINFYRFTPNWGDSNKFFLYLNLLLCLYAGRLVARLWHHSRGGRFAAGALLGFCALVPTAIEWLSRYQRDAERLFSGGDQLVADWIRLNTPKDAIFLTANSFVHPVTALAGRRVVNGSYTRETGYADERIETLVARAYRQADPSLIGQVPVSYVFAGPEEDTIYYINRATWGRRHKLLFDQICQGYRYSIYEVSRPTPEERAREAELEAARPFVWLSELEPQFVQQPYGTVKYDKTFCLLPLKLAGQSYLSGLGTHAPSELRYALDGRYAAFEAILGIDDSQTDGIGTVVFEVWVDDRLRYTSPVKHAGQAPERIRVDLTEARMLRLVVNTTEDGNHCDHANWAEARLLRAVPPPPP